MTNLKRTCIFFSFLCIWVALGGCSFSANFFILNKTRSPIQIEINLSSATNSRLAFNDTIYLLNLTPKQTNDYEENNEINYPPFTKISRRNSQFNFTLPPMSAAKSDGWVNNPKIGFEDRHSLFENILNMKIIRYDTKDTVDLKPSYISDFSKPFQEMHLALIFD